MGKAAPVPVNLFDDADDTRWHFDGEAYVRVR